MLYYDIFVYVFTVYTKTLLSLLMLIIIVSNAYYYCYNNNNYYYFNNYQCFQTIKVK